MCYNTSDLVAAVKELIESEDNTGCTEDLTVVSKKAVDKLARIYPQFAPEE